MKIITPRYLANFCAKAKSKKDKSKKFYKQQVSLLKNMVKQNVLESNYVSGIPLMYEIDTHFTVSVHCALKYVVCSNLLNNDFITRGFSKGTTGIYRQLMVVMLFYLFFFYFSDTKHKLPWQITASRNMCKW